ncbi:LytR/AlgR family response regulator transcription factor [Hymenobacter weizhouensis]|uniref:LytR/AlgR family response regulator transcription factor n=1 Tax=Hymenobacter sp. YIM 151500-1 TaxID=2987689 RepID=UPI002227E463|nr:LytTR family DNA-binding domain-containing protein [Hymenobacter sp. YIM 151500-1]UYZ62798.1 LytTR family DNA-binding domain-containing protein [Hymenobacter sp. YIM 151500-1]
MTLNCIAVDDEPLALRLVASFIEQTPFLKLVGTYNSAVAALRGLQQTPAVDVLFLDIQMPDLNGLELARILDRGPGSASPRVIFTTAFHQYALEGYKVDALDYLLKPFDATDFERAARKAQAYFELVRRPAPAPTAPGPASAAEAQDYLFLKVEYQLVRVALQDILYIEGLKDYVKVYRRSEARPLLSLTSLKALEEKLPPRRFMRVHRSFIVALDQIDSVSRGLIQVAGHSVPISDNYRAAFEQYLNGWK